MATGRKINTVDGLEKLLSGQVLCQDMVSTPGTQLNSHFILHYGDNKPYFIINFWKPGL